MNERAEQEERLERSMSRRDWERENGAMRGGDDERVERIRENMRVNERDGVNIPLSLSFDDVEDLKDFLEYVRVPMTEMDGEEIKRLHKEWFYGKGDVR